MDGPKDLPGPQRRKGEVCLMKVMRAFACEKLSKSVGGTLQNSFKTVLTEPSKKVLKFSIALFLNVDPEGDKGKIKVSLLSPEKGHSEALFQREMSIPPGIERPVPIGIEVKLPVKSGKGLYRCLVQIDGKDVFNEPLFELGFLEEKAPKQGSESDAELDSQQGGVSLASD
jgi:hypothetical protein